MMASRQCAPSAAGCVLAFWTTWALAAAIEWQANDFAARNGILCQVSVPPVDLHLDGDRATATFRIFQECLTNIIRHAQAKSVRIALYQQEESILADSRGRRNRLS
jgi:signal transduction histidine kinase